MEEVQQQVVVESTPVLTHWPDAKFIIAPNPILNRASSTVKHEEFTNGSVDELTGLMTRIMTRLDGIGISAVQVNVLKAVFVLDNAIAGETGGHTVFINPIITDRQGSVEMKEGCLSYPGLMVPVKRSEKLTISAQDIKGNQFFVNLEGIGAVAVQHEMDHLAGITFLDNLSKLKRDMYKKKYEKIRRSMGHAH